MKLLLVNPNTSTFVTDRMTAACANSLAGLATVTGVTAVTGPTIVIDHAGNLQAAASVVELGVHHAAGFDAVIVGISTDAGLASLRKAIRTPVAGMLESAMMTASQRGRRIGFMTLGPQMLPLYKAQVDACGFSSQVVSWAAPVLPQAYTATPGSDVDEALISCALRMIEDDQIDTLVMCGAVLAGCRSRLAPRLPVPLIDATEAAAWQAVALARQDR